MDHDERIEWIKLAEKHNQEQREEMERSAREARSNRGLRRR
jgi:hypothetical protein